MEASTKAAGVGVGDVLAGKYRVDGVLGAGGMGVVVAAHHLQLDERVALKFLLPGSAANEEAMARFGREARAAVKIKSEHVARVIDVGTLETGAPYIVMEFLEGGDLGAWIRQKGPLRIDQAVEFILQACEAIAEAHSLGIVHRDLKPANLFVVRRNDGVESVKVLDFGISKFASGSAGDMSGTRTNTIMGSPYYMSPEQMRSSRDVDAQTDIWAIGIILYELLTGKTPFMGDTFSEICVKVATDPPAPVRQARPEVPEGLEAIIMQCVEKDRRNRYKDVADLADALQEFAPRRALASVERIFGILNRTAGRTHAASAIGGGTLSATMGPFGRTEAYTDSFIAMERRRVKSRRVVVSVLVVGALAVFAGAFAVFPRAPSTPPAAETKMSAAPPTPALVPIPPVPILPSNPPAAPVSDLPRPPAAVDPPPAIVPAHPAPSHANAKWRAGSAAQAEAPRPAHSPNPAATSPAPVSAHADPNVAATAHPPTPADCDPPFTFDSNGIRIFKKECVNE
jgi:hypothetical protein